MKKQKSFQRFAVVLLAVMLFCMGCFTAYAAPDGAVDGNDGYTDDGADPNADNPGVADGGADNGSGEGADPVDPNTLVIPDVTESPEIPTEEPTDAPEDSGAAEPTDPPEDSGAAEPTEEPEDWQSAYTEPEHLDELPTVYENEVEMPTAVAVPPAKVSNASLFSGIVMWLCVAVGIAVVVGVMVSKRTRRRGS